MCIHNLTMVSLYKTNSMGKEPTLGTQAKHTQETGLEVKWTRLGNSIGQMGLFIEGCTNMIRDMAKGK